MRYMYLLKRSMSDMCGPHHDNYRIGMSVPY